MTKKSSLTEALRRSSKPKPEPEAPAQAPGVPPSRVGKKTIAGHFEPAVSRQLRMLAIEEGSSVQELLREALNDLFTKRGKPPIA